VSRTGTTIRQIEFELEKAEHGRLPCDAERVEAVAQHARIKSRPSLAWTFWDSLDDRPNAYRHSVRVNRTP
jgi:hypothetical protein